MYNIWRRLLVYSHALRVTWRLTRLARDVNCPRDAYPTRAEALKDPNSSSQYMAKLTMRRLFACAFAAVASAASREVQKLRAARSTCTINTTRGPEPTARFVVFTKQRSGSRWFVNALALRSNGSFQSHIPEIEFRGFGLREVRRAKGAYSACHSKVASKKCSCAMRRFFTAHAHTRPGFGNGYADSTHARVGGCVDKATTCHMGYKWMVDTSDTGHRRGKQHFVPYRYDKKFPPGFTAVAASICELRIPYIFMWRKNTLRRMISNAANQHTTKSARRKHIDPHACPVPLTVRGTPRTWPTPLLSEKRRSWRGTGRASTRATTN